MNVKIQIAILVVVGVILIVGSLIFQANFQRVFDNILAKKLTLQPGSKTLEAFKSPPVPIFMQFYIFNLTNKEEVLEGALPVLQQVGPYTYAEKQLKYNLSFDEAEGTVTYLQNKTFVFREDMSEGHTEADQITTINAVMMSLGSKFSNFPAGVKALVEMWFMRFGVEPFVTKSVGELLFHGYHDPMLASIGSITKDPVQLTGKFGFFYPKNNTNDGFYKVYSGVKGMHDYQNIVSWKGEPQVNFWKEDLWGGDTCNMINGTSGNQFPQPVLKTKPLHLYTAELCRSIYAEFQREVRHGSVTLYRYVLPDRLLADTPENRCYCTDDFSCRASMINVSPCRKGAPVVMSTPHFYQGNPEDAAIVGLSPRAEEHETYLDVEPTTGVTMRAAKRIQVNMPLHRYSNLPSFRKVPDVIFPIMWVNESAVVPLERTEALHRTLTLPFTLVTVGTWVLVGLGVLLLVVAAVKGGLALRNRNAGEKTAKAKNRRGREGTDKENGVTDKLNADNY